MPANFKTYEAQSRLLAALIGAHPELRLNYKAIAQHYGNSQTMSAIEHRFRPIRTAAQALRCMVEQKKDPELLVDIFDKNAISELFGESTADGIQFQFRAIKQSAEVLKNAVENGQDPVAAFTGGKPAGNATGGSTPTKPTPRKRPRAPKSTAATPKSVNKKDAATPATGTTKPRRKLATPKYVEDAENDESSFAVDYDELDASPTKQVKKVRTIPLKNPPLNQVLLRGATNPLVSPPRQQHQSADGNSSGTSPTASSSIATPNDANDEVAYLKTEVVDTSNRAATISSFEAHDPFFSFSQSSSTGGSAGHCNNAGFNNMGGSNPSAGSFADHPGTAHRSSIFGDPTHDHAPAGPQFTAHGHGHHQLPSSYNGLPPGAGVVGNHGQFHHHHASAPAAPEQQTEFQKAQADLGGAFGRGVVEWNMSNSSIFDDSYYDNGDV